MYGVDCFCQLGIVQDLYLVGGVVVFVCYLVVDNQCGYYVCQLGEDFGIVCLVGEGFLFYCCQQWLDFWSGIKQVVDLYYFGYGFYQWLYVVEFKVYIIVENDGVFWVVRLVVSVDIIYCVVYCFVGQLCYIDYCGLWI